MKKPVYVVCDNKGADQPAHPRSLLSAFVVRYLYNTSSFYIRNYKSVSGLCGCGLGITWSQTPMTGYLATRLNYYSLGLLTTDFFQPLVALNVYTKMFRGYCLLVP